MHARQYARRWLRSLLPAALLVLAGGSVQALDIHYLIYEQVEPLQMTSERDPLKGGLVTEVVQRVLEGSKHQLKPVVAPAKRMAMLRDAGQLPNWLSYGASPWLDGYSELSADPIFVWRHALVVPAGSDFHYRSLHDLFGKRLILMHGYDYPGLDPYLRSVSASGQIDDQRPSSQAGALRMLVSERGAGYVDVDLRLKYNLRRMGLRQNDFRFYDFSDVIAPIDMHLMFDRSMPAELKSELNARLHALQLSGELARIVARYQR